MLSSQQEKGWGRVVLDAPESKNKLSRLLLRKLFQLLDHQAKNSALRFLSIESRCELVFATGADMNELLELDAQRAGAYS